MSPSIFTLLGYFSVVLIVILLFFWSTYNTFIVRRNQVKADYSDIDIQLRRRASLIEQLAQMVREYAKHEKETFENVAKARSALDNSTTVHDVAKADNIFSESLRSLFAVVENYPELKANESYKILIENLKETENYIASYREEYNESVRRYNNAIQTFPNLISALVFRFQEEEFFQASNT